MEYIIEILSGLPGSGKTTYAKEKAKEEQAIHIEIDKLYSKSKLYSDKKNWFKKEIIAIINRATYYHPTRSPRKLIIDGLFLTNKDVFDVIDNILIDVLDPTTVKKICIIQWNEDRENCLLNDKYRRDEHSENTIKNAPFEKISIETLKKLDEDNKYNLDKIAHRYTRTVMKKPEWENFIEDYISLDKDNKNELRSETWTTGGTYRSWSDDSISPISADPTPEDFEEFDKLLEKIAPNITFLEYKSQKKINIKQKHLVLENILISSVFSFYTHDIRTIQNQKKGVL